MDKHSHDGELPVQLCNYTDVYKNDKVRPGPNLMRATATPDEIARFRLARGDTVLTKDSEDPSDIGVSAFVDDIADDFVCGYHLAIARPLDGTHPRYLTWALRSRPVLDHFSNFASGISRYGLTTAGLKSAPIPKRGWDEQQRIADFLDDRVARIDQIITARRRQQDLLRERVASAITSATTPTHVDGWRLLKFSRVARVNDGLVDPTREPYLTMALVAPNHIEKGTGRLLHLESAADQAAESGKGFVRAGQIIYSKIRPSLRKAAIAPIDCLCSADAYAVSPEATVVSTEYLLLAILGDFFSQQVEELSDRVAMPKVNRESLSEVRLWIPDAATQVTYVRESSELRQATETCMEILTSSLTALSAYKQSLITAAVTGELDVTTAGSGVPG